MEAVPRMPMIWLDLKEAGEFAFNAAVKKFVLKNYGENPENYNEELRKLELLRQIWGALASACGFNPEAGGWKNFLVPPTLPFLLPALP
uniref:Uncharacterized protein n=1 Tax=Strigops habroptila TaxID=2489341 RepID=A0A672TLI5_STRHB